MGEGYVRDVNVSKAIRTVLATDQQLQDLKRLYSDPSAKDFSVLGVDPPSPYVTATTYKHKLLETHQTSKHPVFIGPITVHLHRDTEPYEFFASTQTVPRVDRHLWNWRGGTEEGTSHSFTSCCM